MSLTPPPGQRLTALSGALLIISLMLFGGGVAAFPAVLLFAVIAAALLAGNLFGNAWSAFVRLPWPARLGLVAIAALPLVQLVPLPPSWWHALPGQELRIRVLELSGVADSWQPASLVPVHTAFAAILAIGFVALVVGLVAATPAVFRAAAWLVLGLMALNILVGVIQVASGGSTLRFHKVAHHGAMIGFFANKNHMALMLAACLPLASWLAESARRVHRARVIFGVFWAVALVALVTTNSRAGLALGLIASAVLGVRYLRFRKPLYGFLIVAGVLAGAAIVATSSTFATLFGRYDLVGEDLRWQYLRTSMPLIKLYWPIGAGAGSFSTLYAVNEQIAWVKPTFVNQLHDEYPQLLLEFGIPGALALVALVAGCAMAAVRGWRAGYTHARGAIAAGLLVLGLFAAHSVLDYPARRPATLPMLALALALVLRAPVLDPAVAGRSRQQ